MHRELIALINFNDKKLAKREAEQIRRHFASGKIATDAAVSGYSKWPNGEVISIERGRVRERES